MYGCRISAACLIHDESWELAEATWADFHLSNSMFLHNILAIIRNQGGWLQYLRNYRAVTYYDAVDTFGAAIFRKLKGTVI